MCVVSLNTMFKLYSFGKKKKKAYKATQVNLLARVSLKLAWPPPPRTITWWLRRIEAKLRWDSAIVYKQINFNNLVDLRNELQMETMQLLISKPLKILTFKYFIYLFIFDFIVFGRKVKERSISRGLHTFALKYISVHFLPIRKCFVYYLEIKKKTLIAQFWM